MIRPIAALLLACCLTLPVWAQEPSPASPAQTPASSDQAPTAKLDSTQFPLDRFREFSAIENGGIMPGQDEDGHIYRSGDLMRMQAVNSGPTQYFVDDLVKRTSYGLSLGGCAKLGFLYSRTFPFFMSGPGFTYERVPVGEDTVNGHHVHVEDITVHSKKFTNPAHFRLYEADDLEGFPIKIVNQQAKVRQWVIEYKDVRLGPQDSTLFTVPRDCQSLEGTKPVHPAAPGAKPKTAPADKPK